MGISNITPEMVREYMQVGQVDLMQEKYSILDRAVEAKLLPICNGHKITLQAYAPLEKGLLTGRFGRDYKPESDISSHRKGQMMMQDYNRNLIVDLLEGWQGLCEKYGCSYSNLVVAWLPRRASRWRSSAARASPSRLPTTPGRRACSWRLPTWPACAPRPRL